MKRRSVSLTSADFRLREHSFDLGRVAARETLFTLGNGYIGIRGTYDEGRCTYHQGTYLNGFYDIEPIIYPESAYGYARNKQRMMNVTEGTVVQLYVDDDPFDLSTGKILFYRRILDMKRGMLSRRVKWQSPSGKVVTVESRRLVSFSREHIAAIDWKCTVHGKPATLAVISGLYGKGKPQIASDDPRVGAALRQNALIPTGRKIDDVYGSLRHITRTTRFGVLCMMANEFDTPSRHARFKNDSAQEVSHRFHVNAEAESTVHLTKYLCYFSSIAHAPKKLAKFGQRELGAARAVGFDGLLAEQEAFLSDFWQTADVLLEGDPLLQESVRFNIFHVLQSAGRNSRTNIAAKGLTGEGYEGHYFWDTEIYALPLFLYTNPSIARHLLEYRYNILDRARGRARELDLQGALFPWRTINGDEASAYFPAGTAQYHINADISYAVRKYVQVSGDEEFLVRYGAEIAIETARFWLDLGDYIPGKGYCFNEVTGPNEYTALVNNNAYTNLMARDNLLFAAAAIDHLKNNHPSEFERLSERVHLAPFEAEEWRSAASRVYIPYDENQGLYPQDDSFFDKAVWDFENTPRDRYPLLLYFHPLTIYRYQVLKQPDLVLALFLQGNHFTFAEKKRNFDYYDALTTADSSLSPCVQSIMAAEVGYTDLAYDYFMKTVRMDLDDVNGNTKDGIHAACMAGSWLSLIFGFAGLRDFDGIISFAPRLPGQWTRLKFRLVVRQSVLSVDVGPQSVTYEVVTGPALRVLHHQEVLELYQGAPETRNVTTEEYPYTPVTANPGV